MTARSIKASDAQRLTGEEKLLAMGNPTDLSVLDFWKWAHSDLLSNTQRGILAEFLVSAALGIEKGIRTEWDTHDLCDRQNRKIEVKSAAYLQSWAQTGLSKIQFGIGKKHKWDPSNGKHEPHAARHCDFFIFCLLHTTQMDAVNPLDTDQWTFYVLPSRILDELLGDQKSLSLSALEKLNPAKGSWSEIVALLDQYA